MGRKRTCKKNKHHAKRKSQISPTPDKGTYVQRNYKDTLFRFIFRDKTKLLQLYNALNNSDYDDMDALTVTTIENVLYLGYKNDVSFLLDQSMCLFEHQGTWNPNMPLRGILYFARLFQEYVDLNNLNLYGSKKILLPVPRYVVFYNGTAKRPEREILRLSDMYLTSSESAPPDDESENQQNSPSYLTEEALECKALILNINYGNNQELMEKCKPLMDYSTFIHCIRENLSHGLSITDAVDLAVEDCIKNNILSDVLRLHRKEVTTMFLADHDPSIYHRIVRKEGIDEGEDNINTLAQKMIADNRLEDFLRSTSDKAYQKQLLEEYGLGEYDLTDDLIE